MRYYYIYYSEKLQKVGRKLEHQGMVENYEYLGTMTATELELLKECLFERYGENRIILRQYQRYFGDLKSFCQRLKMILEE